MTRTIIIFIAYLTALGLILRRCWLAYRWRRGVSKRFFARAVEILEHSELLKLPSSSGYHLLLGRYNGLQVQIHPVVDTLPVRRLPALWLLVTVESALPVTARFDLMMRPNAPTTFSNFDHLPSTVVLPAGFPPEAVLRTDDPQHVLPAHLVAPHLDVFEDVRAKELLITPNGVRIVWLLAEANRTRYGVLRDADFGNIDLDPRTLRDLLDRLVKLRRAILDASSTSLPEKAFV